MTRRRIFIFSFSILAIMIIASFFILSKNILAANDLPTHDGTIDNNPTWTHIDCATTTANYLILKKPSSALASPEINLADCSSAKLIFSARAYGGEEPAGAGTSSDIYIYVKTVDQENLLLIDHPTTANPPAKRPEADLSAYCGQIITIIFKTPNATGTKGAGLDDISFTKTVLVANQTPIAVATSSKNMAEINEEIIFNGSQSYDPDGGIADWIWDLAGEIIHASTTSKKFSTTGLKPIYFWAVDNAGASSSIAFNVEIIDSSSSNVAINPGDIVINEIYPAPPTGETEWLELYNNTSSSIDLSGLYLLDAKFSTTTLSGIIAPYGYLLIEDISGNLNNDGDTMTLRNSNQVISQTAYGDFSNKRDQSWALTADSTYMPTIRITKGSANIIEAKATAVSGGGSVSSIIADPSSTSTNSIATSTAIDYRGRIIINEILPNPVGADEGEFIELKNISQSDIILNDFYLADNTNTKHRIKSADKLIITAGGLAVISRASSTIALNNSGFEAINLYDPEGELVDRITYSITKSEGQAYARNDSGEWLWTATPTPGEENIFDNGQEVLAAAAVIVSKARATAKKAILNYGLIELEKAPELPDGSLVIIRGVVSAEPGDLGVQVFYLAGSGIQVYSYKKDFPDLKVGDYIEVSGELSTATTGRRLKIKTKGDIKFLEHREPPLAHQLSLTEINADYENSLVKVNGEVIQIKGRSIFIDDGEIELEVYVKSQIDFKDLNIQDGDKLEVTGIVTKNKESERLLPRTLADLKVTKGQVKGEFEKKSDRIDWNNYYPWLLVIFLLGLLGLNHFRKIKNRSV